MSTRVVPGSGADFIPVFNNTLGVESFTIISGGSGYASTDPPQIKVEGTQPPVTEGVFYPIIKNGEIVKIAIIDPGYGYFPVQTTNSTKIGIGTTSYVESSLIVKKGPDTAPYLSVASTESSIIMQVEGSGGSSLFENGYNAAISTSITGTSSTITPDNSLQLNRFYGFFDPFPSYATSGTGTDAKFSAFIVYESSTGIPISTSLVLREGGRGYAIGDTVSISGTFMNGTSPTNDLSFTVSSVANTRIPGEANNVYQDIPGVTLIGGGSGATFDISRDSLGDIISITVKNGGVGYALTDVVGVAGTYVGGVTPADDLFLTPKVLGTDKLPSTLYVTKVDNNTFRVSGLSTANELNITSYGSGEQTINYDNPNASAIISIDNIIQSPLYRRDLNVGISTIVGLSTNILYLTGISSITTIDVVQINSEYFKINSIGLGATNAIQVTRGYLGSQVGYHTVGAAVTILRGDYNIKDDKINFTTAPYGPTGYTGLKINSTFSGRAFSRRFDPGTPNDKNVIFDDISTKFVGASSTEFFLSNYEEDIVGIYTNTNTVLTSGLDVNNNPIVLINNIPQISETDFTIDNPERNRIKFLTGTPGAGKISRVGINSAFGYQPQLGAGATVTVGVGGTIADITLLTSGSGYREAPEVRLISASGSGAEFATTIGAGGTVTSISIVNAGTGYTTNPETRVVIGIPTSYSDLPLVYTNGTTGNGEGARASVVVGNSGDIIQFEMEEPGIYYKVGDQLTISGIITNPQVGAAFTGLTITVEDTLTDKFSGFYPGQFVQFDDISRFFNGSKKKFTLTVSQGGDTQVLSLKTDPTGDLTLENNLFVYINDVLQQPTSSYIFNGSRIQFKEAPKQNSKCTILFYRGSDLDVEQVDPPQTIKEGDTVQIGDNILNPEDRPQFERVVKKIISSDSLDTFTYDSIGINTDPTKVRPLKWIKQTADKIINGVLYSKSRPDLKSRVEPTAKLIKSLYPEDNVIYVDNAFPIFSEIDNLSENIRDVNIVDIGEVRPAIATAIVSSASTVSSINIVDGGTGYYRFNDAPVVAISSAAISRKDPIYNWIGSNNGLSTAYTINRVAIGTIANPLVAVGSSGFVGLSTDGVSWAQTSIGYGGTISFNSALYAEQNIVYSVGDNAKVVTNVGLGSVLTGTGSTITSWTELKLLEATVVVGLPDPIISFSTYDNNLNDVTYSRFRKTLVAVGDGPGVFVGVGIGTTALYQKRPPSFTNLKSIANNDATFVAVGESGSIIFSRDGGNIWDRIQQLPSTRNFQKVIWTGTQFIAVGEHATIFTSISGWQGWTRVTPNVGDHFYNIKYEYGVYVAVNQNGELLFSLDLQYWTKRDTNQSNQIVDLAFIPAPPPAPVRNPNDRIIAEDGRYVLVGHSGTTMYAEPIYNRATGIATITNGTVSNVTIVNPGFGYSQMTPPPIIVESGTSYQEKIYSIKAAGDFGIIKYVGVGATYIDFELQSEQYDNATLGIGYSSLDTFGILNSQLSVGDYFVITESNSPIGHALTGITTSLGGLTNYPASKVGTATSYLDGVYRVERVTEPVAGIVTVRCMFALAPGGGAIQVDINQNTNGVFGRYSWGKIYDFQNRIKFDPKTFIINSDNGLVGISSGPDVYRTRGIR